MFARACIVLEDFGNIVARVIDELQEDLADIVMEETDGIGVDYIVETKALRATSDSTSPSNTKSGLETSRKNRSQRPIQTHLETHLKPDLPNIPTKEAIQALC